MKDFWRGLLIGVIIGLIILFLVLNFSCVAISDYKTVNGFFEKVDYMSGNWTNPDRTIVYFSDRLPFEFDRIVYDFKYAHQGDFIQIKYSKITKKTQVIIYDK